MLAKLFPVKKGEGRTVFFLMLYLLVVCIGTSLGIAVSTSILLETFGAAKLPYIFVGISFCSLLTSSFYTFAIKKVNSSAIYRIFLPIAAVSILICNFLIRNDYRFLDISVGIVIQYVAFFVFLGIEIINFNNYSSSYLNPIQKKRLYSFILSATKMGGIVGGLSLSYLLKFYDQNNVLLLWPIAYILSLLVLIVFEKKAQTSLNTNKKKINRVRKSNFFRDLVFGVKQVKSNHFYMLFASLIALDICCGSLIIYQFNEGLSQVFAGKSQALSAFLGKFCAIANIVALSLQMFVAPRLSQSFGVTKINFLFPSLSLLILIISLFSWELGVIALLMFHKDYIMSVFHFPNRAQFYNGVDSQKRGFFLGFFEGIWTHSVNMCFGILLILVVQFAPVIFPSLKSGFAYSFSLVGILLFSIYIVIAYKLVSAYKEQLVLLMSVDDVQTKVKSCKLNYEDLKLLFPNELDEYEIYDFMNSCEDIHLENIIVCGEATAIWKVMDLYPQSFKSIVDNLSHEQKLKIVLKSNDKALAYGFEIGLSDQKIKSKIEELNIRRSMKYFDALFVYIALFDQKSIMTYLESIFFSLKSTQQLKFLKLINYFEQNLSKDFVDKLIAQLYKQSMTNQQAIFQSLLYQNEVSNLSTIFLYFDSNSVAIRNSALKLVSHLTKQLKDSSQILEFYFEKKWSSHARTCWFELFSSLEAEIQSLAKKELFKAEKLSLMKLLESYVVLQDKLTKGSTLLELIEQDIFEQLRFFLLFFDEEFDKDCLRIIDKSLLDLNSKTKYEAIELLSSADNKDICALLMPFLESSSLLEVYEVFHQDLPSNKSIEIILGDILDGDCAWMRALAIYEITNLKLTALRDKILTYKNCTEDLYSGEMVEYCINEWSLQNEME
ncbi:MAG: hypothetical protein KC646_03810 [Candidatus Cloacimonetes bacterium]|nr:hypothetical protein [Candidatus Cloacimonadota bacterium]